MSRITNYQRFFNFSGRAREPAYLRSLVERVFKECSSDVLSLNAGLPNPALFPFKDAVYHLKDGTELKIDDSLMKTAQQYNLTSGFEPFRQQCLQIVKKFHNPPTLGTQPKELGLSVTVTNGSAEGYTRSLEMLVGYGDHVIVEEATFPAALSELRALGAQILDVPTDEQGLCPSALRQALSKWKPEDADDPKSDVPKVMYLVPTGCNPTGHTIPVERKREIYEIAREYNLLIIEDDPYYFLQYERPLVPSFLSIDEDGRVLRADSFSKCIAAGFRLGILSGPTPLLEKIQMHVGISIEHTSNLSQIAFNKLLDHWGQDGFDENVRNVGAFYQGQQKAMEAACQTWMGELAEWTVPKAGMYYWIRLKTLQDSRKLCEEKAFAKEVILSPGCAFMVDSTKPCPYVRASFSLLKPEQMEEAMKRLADVIKSNDTT